MNSYPVGSPWGWQYHKWSLRTDTTINHIEGINAIKTLAKSGITVPGRGESKIDNALKILQIIELSERSGILLSITMGNETTITYSLKIIEENTAEQNKELDRAAESAVNSLKSVYAQEA